MVVANSWRALSEGPADGVVLAVDYPFSGRPEAGFSDLAAKLDPPYSLWETVPPLKGAEAGMTGTDYLRWWLDGIIAPGQRVLAVLGFCAGSVYASTLAQRIEADQGIAPKVVLFDPEAPNAITVYWQFHKVIDGLGVILTPEEVAGAQRAGHQVSQETPDLTRLRERLFEIFEEAGETAFSRAGLDAVRREDFTSTVGSFLSYLVAAAGIDARPGWSTATAISSTTATNGLNLLTPEERGGVVAKEIRFDIEHADLLRDADVVRTVSELLGPGS
jgi:hypothetical protein